MKSLPWLLALGLALPLETLASSATFLGSGNGPGGVGVSASAVFSITGDDLTITLTNTSAAHPSGLQDVPGSTLTGIFWNSPSNWVLSTVSATLATGSTIIQRSFCTLNCVGVTNVGGEFGYQAASITGGTNHGIASSGYLTTGSSGNVGNFPGGTNLSDPLSLDGINFGIVSSASGFNPNPGQLGSVPLIQSAVVFALSGVKGLTIADISNVSFQYGTGLNELNVPGNGTVPEPGSAALVGISLLGALVSSGRRRA